MSGSWMLHDIGCLNVALPKPPFTTRWSEIRVTLPHLGRRASYPKAHRRQFLRPHPLGVASLCRGTSLRTPRWARRRGRMTGRDWLKTTTQQGLIRDMQGGEMHSYCTKGRERREGGSGWVSGKKKSELFLLASALSNKLRQRHHETKHNQTDNSAPATWQPNKKKSPFLTQRFTDSLLVGNCKEFRRGKKRQQQCFLASTHLSLSALSEQITHLLSAAQTRSQNEQITRFLWEWAGPVGARGFQHTPGDWFSDLQDSKNMTHANSFARVATCYFIGYRKRGGWQHVTTWLMSDSLMRPTWTWRKLLLKSRRGWV